jgi:diguanylate cyclase
MPQLFLQNRILRNPTMPAPLTAQHFPHQIDRTALLHFTHHALEMANGAATHVGVLMLTLTRRSRQEALFGASTASLVDAALILISDALRAEDLYARLSDDTLCFILPNLKSPTQCLLAAARFSRCFEIDAEFEEHGSHSRPAIGIAFYPDHALDAKQLILCAEIARGAAYSEEASHHVFTQEDQTHIDLNDELHPQLRLAIQNSELELYYQPQINCKTMRCESAEALIRWNLEGLGTVPADKIINIAEARGLINSLTTWVFNTALRQIGDFARAGVELGISVNLSSITLTNEDLPSIVNQCLRTWQVDPAKLTIEVTESVTLADLSHAKSILQGFKGQGIRIAIDDFGTGYSSLAYLRHLPLDELKIDQLFVKNAANSPADRDIIAAVIRLAHQFKVITVAEGAEDNATIDMLRGMGCDIAQGYGISHPLPASQFLEWVKTHNHNVDVTTAATRALAAVIDSYDTKTEGIDGA